MTYAKKDGQKWVFQDFTSHFNVVRQIWRQVTPRPYPPEGQRALYSAWLGETPPAGLIYGYSPTLLLLLAPLLSLSSFTAYLAYGLANAIAAGLLVYGLIGPRSRQQPWQWVAVLLCFFSVAFFSVFQFGQTVVLTTAALGAIWALLYDPSTQQWRASRWRGDLALSLLLWALSAKPNIAIFSGVLLVAAFRWRALALTACWCVLTTLVTAPYLGGWPVWWQDYLRLLSLYHDPAVQTSFLSWSSDPDNFTNFLQVLTHFNSWPYPLQSRFSSSLWLAGLILLLGTQVLRTKPRPVLFFQINLLLALIFNPNLLHTEDFLLVLLFLDEPLEKKDPLRPALLLALALAVNTNAKFGIFSGLSIAFWPWSVAAKVALLILLCFRRPASLQSFPLCPK
jgi:hypothetical protein